MVKYKLYETKKLFIIISDMETVYLVFLIICTLIFIAIISLSVVHLIVVYRRIKEEAIQNDLYFLILLLPVNIKI